ncbi:uncharacterized protein BX664DRAFT_328945 [Halteromyces radiatus]|uniref:uncharacterized protein n=1 Tax=Halteromyces radiatus TaxID=101107 RepID=UPI0022200C37|nr:uncharacterized protein BX664DRAFT_328945 [Halteromyces radiatus]KAI8093107.1 hypothetical protein BX664DRAFT_328945 [Halteromyces radiatus]
MDNAQLEKALLEMPIETLLTEIPEIQNSMVHLIQSNKDMKEYDPNGEDTDLTTAIEENNDLIQRQNKRIDLTLHIIRRRVNEAAANAIESTVETFRKRYLTNDDSHKETVENDKDDNMNSDGVFL